MFPGQFWQSQCSHTVMVTALACSSLAFLLQNYLVNLNWKDLEQKLINLLFAGICSIFQFIYYHQYKWDQIEKNNVSEHSGKD